MYTKATPQEHRRIIIPDNYRGNAFNEEKSESKIDDAPPVIEVKEEEKKQSPQIPSILSSILPPRKAKSHGIFQNVGIEELLIIGTMIVLLINDSDEDIILLLLLLLFY